MIVIYFNNAVVIIMELVFTTSRVVYLLRSVVIKLHAGMDLCVDVVDYIVFVFHVVILMDNQEVEIEGYYLHSKIFN